MGLCDKFQNQVTACVPLQYSSIGSVRVTTDELEYQCLTKNTKMLTSGHVYNVFVHDSLKVHTLSITTCNSKYTEDF